MSEQTEKNSKKTALNSSRSSPGDIDTSTSSHQDQASSRCCTCGSQITTREISLLEGEPCCQSCLLSFASAVRRAIEIPAFTGSLIPWLRREELGVVRAFVQTVIDGLSNPTRFFTRLPAVSAPWTPLLFALVCTLVFYFPGLFINQAFALPVIVRALERAPEGEQLLTAFAPVLDQLALHQSVTNWILLLIQFIMMEVLFASWVQQIFVYLAGSRRGFELTLQVRCYSLVGICFVLIPFVGSTIALIYWITINAVGLREAHGISGWVSVLAAGSTLLVSLMAAISILSVFGFWAVALSGLPGNP